MWICKIRCKEAGFASSFFIHMTPNSCLCESSSLGVREEGLCVVCDGGSKIKETQHMIQGKTDLNLPGLGTVCNEGNAMSPRLAQFCFHILIFKLILRLGVE
jgi:hypothetical protein